MAFMFSDQGGAGPDAMNFGRAFDRLKLMGLSEEEKQRRLLQEQKQKEIEKQQAEQRTVNDAVAAAPTASGEDPNQQNLHQGPGRAAKILQAVAMGLMAAGSNNPGATAANLLMDRLREKAAEREARRAVEERAKQRAHEVSIERMKEEGAQKRTKTTVEGAKERTMISEAGADRRQQVGINAQLMQSEVDYWNDIGLAEVQNKYATNLELLRQAGLTDRHKKSLAAENARLENQLVLGIQGSLHGFVDPVNALTIAKAAVTGTLTPEQDFTMQQVGDMILKDKMIQREHNILENENIIARSIATGSNIQGGGIQGPIGLEGAVSGGIFAPGGATAAGTRGALASQGGSGLEAERQRLEAEAQAKAQERAELQSAVAPTVQDMLDRGRAKHAANPRLGAYTSSQAVDDLVRLSAEHGSPVNREVAVEGLIGTMPEKLIELANSVPEDVALRMKDAFDRGKAGAALRVYFDYQKQDDLFKRGIGVQPR
jgi:hypothetical protein